MIRLRLARLGDRDVDRATTQILDVGARRIEVRIRGDDLTLDAQAREENALGGPALVGRNDVAEAGELFDTLLESEPRARARIRLVAAHDARPLFRGHRPRPRIGEQVDQDVFRADPEHVPTRRDEKPPPLLARRHADRFDALDAKGLDDRPHAYLVGAPRMSKRGA
jgi:hypothetical protein